jgi:lipoprotein-anchoring transpeptidase ErfK/SrfK
MKHRGGAVPCFHLRVLGVLSAALIGLLLVLPPQLAHGQQMGWWAGNPSPYPRRALKTYRHSRATSSRETDAAEHSRKTKAAADAQNKPTGPLFAILSLSDQHISIYNSAGLVTRSKVSTGMPGHRTPMGIFTIIGRERYHSSNIYSGAAMPFMQRITWSGVAMHLGVVPGYPASHGCIRLPASFAHRLWGLTKIGERVIIAPHEIAPSEFAHPLLPVPKMWSSPLALAESMLPIATEVAAAGNDSMPVASSKLLNPLEYAQALRASAATEIAEATKTLQKHGQHKDQTADTIRSALSDLRAAETERTRAEAKLAGRIEVLATKRDARDIQRAKAAKAAAEAHLVETSTKFRAAFDNPAFTTPEGSEALEAERKLLEIRASIGKARAAAKEAGRFMSPISVLVSMNDKKVYIRQALAPVLEARVVIRGAEAPLGTHVYIATSHNGSSLSWTTVSLPSSTRSGRGAGERMKPGVDQTPASSNAAQAIERIEFPAEVSALIAERLWTGGSLIITDEALSDETSDIGTDLVVVVR